MIKLYEFTFESTGYTVKFRRVPASLAWDIRREADKDPNKPKPKMQEVELFGEKKLEVNASDPEYAAALNEWDTVVGKRVYHAMLVRGLVEYDKEALAEAKAQLEAIGQHPHEGMHDSLVFIYHVAGAAFSEITALVEAIHAQSAPTEGAIAAAAASFPGAAGEGRAETGRAPDSNAVQ